MAIGTVPESNVCPPDEPGHATPLCHDAIEWLKHSRPHAVGDSRSEVVNLQGDETLVVTHKGSSHLSVRMPVVQAVRHQIEAGRWRIARS